MDLIGHAGSRSPRAVNKDNAEDKPKKKPLRRVSLSNRIEKREGRKEEKKISLLKE